MSKVRRALHPDSNDPERPHSNDPERLPLRWGVILMAAAGAGAFAFAVAGPLVAIGTAGFVVATLHKVLA